MKDLLTKNNTTDEVLDSLESQLDELAQDSAGWQIREELLYQKRIEILDGFVTSKYHVERPEFVANYLERIHSPTDENKLLVQRLLESNAYPTFDSPLMRAKFDRTRRKLLAMSGHLKEAIEGEIPDNPAAELYGMLRGLVSDNNLTANQISELLSLNLEQLYSPKVIADMTKLLN
jgi:hypothetical protein